MDHPKFCEMYDTHNVCMCYAMYNITHDIHYPRAVSTLSIDNVWWTFQLEHSRVFFNFGQSRTDKEILTYFGECESAFKYRKFQIPSRRLDLNFSLCRLYREKKYIQSSINEMVSEWKYIRLAVTRSTTETVQVILGRKLHRYFQEEETNTRRGYRGHKYRASGVFAHKSNIFQGPLYELH